MISLYVVWFDAADNYNPCGGTEHRISYWQNAKTGSWPPSQAGRQGLSWSREGGEVTPFERGRGERGNNSQFDSNQMVTPGQSHLQESRWQFSDCLVFTDMRFVKSFTQAYFLTF